jgi:hypothetical protein
LENLEETLQRETEDFAENNGFEQTCSFAIEALKQSSGSRKRILPASGLQKPIAKRRRGRRQIGRLKAQAGYNIDSLRYCMMAQ